MLIFRAETALPLYICLHGVRADDWRLAEPLPFLGADGAVFIASANFSFFTSDYCHIAKYARSTAIDGGDRRGAWGIR